MTLWFYSHFAMEHGPHSPMIHRFKMVVVHIYIYMCPIATRWPLSIWKLAYNPLELQSQLIPIAISRTFLDLYTSCLAFRILPCIPYVLLMKNPPFSDGFVSRFHQALKDMTYVHQRSIYWELIAYICPVIKQCRKIHYRSHSHAKTSTWHFPTFFSFLFDNPGDQFNKHPSAPESSRGFQTLVSGSRRWGVRKKTWGVLTNEFRGKQWKTIPQSSPYWLVVGPPLWKIWKSIGMISNPRYGKIKNGNQTTNQP